MARVPFWKFIVADTGAAALGVPFLFGLAYFFMDEITAIVADVHRVERWLGLAGLLVLAAVLVVSVWRGRRHLGTERLEGDQSEGPAPHP
jgi:membrane protein DedA with SNARE-associated domain